MFNSKFFNQLQSSIPASTTIVAVSKFHPAAAIIEAYDCGVRIFGESRPQELLAKYEQLPKDIEWHMIGHLQTNKIKYIAPFVALIQSVDSLKLAEAINKEGEKINRRIPILMQLHVAQEESKQGFSPDELIALFRNGALQELRNIEIQGLMAMASLTSDNSQIKREFLNAKSTFDTIKSLYLPSINIVSMGMSDDYPMALECGSNTIRIGSALFGNRL